MIKILFMIDDDQDDRDVFREAVANCDPKIEMMFAKDGIEALQILDSSIILPDVIFLDYNMPRMNGLECLKRLKGNSDTKDIPTIMYTTSGDREQENVVLLFGADYYMQKTVNFKSLCQELSRLFDLIERNALKDLKRKRPHAK